MEGRMEGMGGRNGRKGGGREGRRDCWPVVLAFFPRPSKLFGFNHSLVVSCDIVLLRREKEIHISKDFSPSYQNFGLQLSKFEVTHEKSKKMRFLI